MIIEKSGNFGDLKKAKVEINDIDIIQAVSELRIFQDVFTPTWNCQILVEDTTNMIMRLPISAGDKVKILIESEVDSPLDDDKEFEFVIHRIGDKKLVHQFQQSYVLYCASEPFLKNIGKRVSKSFSNKKATEIAAAVAQEFLSVEVETKPSSDNIHTVIPNWSPLNTIAWCLRHATDKNAADYLFFQVDNGKFSMKPFEHLYSSRSESSEITFVQKTANYRDGGDYVDDYSVAVIEFEVEHADGVKNMASGLYRSRKLSYDMINKKWEQRDFTYGDDCTEDAINKPWKSTVFEESADANVSFIPKHPGMHSSQTYLDQQDVWEPSRKSAIQKMNQERLFIQIPGSVGTWKMVGKNCIFNMPSHEQTDDEKFDKYRKGRYLVVAVCHIITKKSYITNLELLKKRLEQPLE